MTTQQLRTLQERGGEFLFDELVKIPFILTGLGVPSNLIINQQVRQVDIFPTLCQLIGVSNDLGSINGRSLVPLLNEQSLTEEPAYIESGSVSTKKLGKVIGIRTTNYKYLRSRNDLAKNVTLYDLKNDPDETTNIAHSNEQIINEMERTLQKIRSGDIMDSPKEMTSVENEKIEKELRKLGYIE